MLNNKLGRLKKNYYTGEIKQKEDFIISAILNEVKSLYLLFILS